MKRSKFSLSHGKLMSGNMGKLMPCGLVEVLPGDSIQQATSVLLRVSPLLAPVYHACEIRVHHWFVPHRLIWEDWEDFITGGPDGMDDSEFPTINMTYTNPTTGNNQIGGLGDYLGIPPGINNLEVSALPFRAYAMVYNEWYRDQDLVDPVGLSIESGVDSTTSTALLNVAWEKDYFTSARPWEQKGPAITIPLGDSAPIHHGASAGQRVGVYSDAQGGVFAMGAGGSEVTNSAVSVPAGAQQLYADLTGVSAVTVNILREAMALQRYEEARARFGSRYTEYLRYLGVRSSDARLQRPEYLGGGKQVIQFSEVLQTAEGSNPVGSLLGHGIGAARSNRYRRFFEEHGYIISCVSIRPKTVYADGLFRTWNRRTKEDFWQVELQHIGQQEVLNKEVYAAHATPDGTFGFQDRYDEYRRQESQIAGEFRETMLDYWHMARMFDSSPALNQSFIECVPTDRIFAVPSEDTLYLNVRHSIQARRMVAQTGRSYIF